MKTKQSLGGTTTETDLVRASRDGDQFHYHWAARHCLSLLPGASDLVAISIEGASAAEDIGAVKDGDELIDVGFYYGDEQLRNARLVRYVQLKHSTVRAHEPWTASGLGKTLAGFAKRFKQLREQFSWAELKDRLRFSFTTNRPINEKVIESLEDLAKGSAARHPTEQQTLLGYAKGLGSETTQFFQLFEVEPGEPDLWNQRNLLFADIRSLLASADSDAPLQLKELVARKATSEFESNPSITRTDVLRALKTDIEDLLPAPCWIKSPPDVIAREQEAELRSLLEAATRPIVLHAEGGVGKSVLALQLSRSVPAGSVAVLYDCFGDGLYRNSLHFRHRHKDALPQIANELAALGLCLPLVPAGSSDAKQFMRAFVARLDQLIGLLRARNPSANLYLIVDAADNAVMAARETGDSSFVPDLVRAPLPQGVKLVLTCRTHRQEMLEAPPDAVKVPLRPFSDSETARHLRQAHPQASDAEVKEFAFLSSANPRVQALALSRKKSMAEMLKELGPAPSTVERAISELLQAAIDQLKYRSSHIEVEQIDLICQGLAILRPLVPIAVLARVSGVAESAVKSFAYDLGRPLLVKGDFLHFLDEPSETWFRENFYPDQAKLQEFLDRLRPLAETSAYVASTVPQLLLAAGKMDELVSLALSNEGLPSSNPLERRDIEVQRLTFALKAALQGKRYAGAAKLGLKVAGELAGVERQNSLIQRNTDIASVLLSGDRLEELVSRRTFADSWHGAHHAYDAGLLSGRTEFLAVARSRLRMAREWLRAWARTPEDERDNQKVDDNDIAEIAMAILFTAGPKQAAAFVRGWSPRRIAMDVGKLLTRRLADLGRFNDIDGLATEGASDLWLMLGITSESCEIGHCLPAAPVQRLMRALGSRRIRLEDTDRFNAHWQLLGGVTCAIMQALKVLPRDDETWAKALRRYMPDEPPRDFFDHYPTDMLTPLRAYALEAALKSKPLILSDLAPTGVRGKRGSSHSHSSEADAFDKGVGGIVHWFTLNAEIACGRTPGDFASAVAAARSSTDKARSKDYQNHFHLEQTAALEWLRALRDSASFSEGQFAEFKARLEGDVDGLWPATLIDICRISARCKRLEALAMEAAVKAFNALESSRDEAETRADSYQRLARAVYPTSKAEAIHYFDRAVELSSRIGNENLDRWSALVSLAQATEKGGKPRPRSAYRFARGAELTYEYVVRDKHFPWHDTIEGLLSLCAPSTLAILSRWRDRNFGNEGRLLCHATEGLVDRGLFPSTALIALCPIGDYWSQGEDLIRGVEDETDKNRRGQIFRVGYRYLRIVGASETDLARLQTLCSKYGLDAPDLQRLAASHGEDRSAKASEHTSGISWEGAPERRDPDWNVLFEGVDLTNSEELRTAYLKLRTFDVPYQTDEFYREGMRRAGAGGAADFCRAVSRWPDFGNSELRTLLAASHAVTSKPMSLRKALGEAALAACRSEPYWARRHRWGSAFPNEELIREKIITDDEIVNATLEGFLTQLTTLDAGELFQMLEPLAHCISGDEADEALHFGLKLLEEDLRPEDADGPWNDELNPPSSCEEAMAAYLWVSLASPKAASRWQAAHAVRASVELEWSGMLKALSERALVGSPGPFIDKRFEFYLWHARQWLLIALARCAADDPESVRAFRDFLLASLKQEHVLLRHFAALAIRGLPDLYANLPAAELPDAINAPSLPFAERSYYWNAVSDEAEDAEPKSGDEKYYFGIDIGPYWFAPLGRVFGLSEGSIERRAVRVISDQLGGHRGATNDDMRRKSKVYDYQDTRLYKSTMPRVEDLKAYTSYHAMMFVAAQLLKTHPVGKSEQSPQDDFTEWLGGRMLSRHDGKWISDRRDPRLTKAPPKSESGSNGDWCWHVTADYLDSVMITDEELLVVSGEWSSGEYDSLETIDVTSALVPRATSTAFFAAAQTAASVHDIYFPLDDYDDRDKDEDAGQDRRDPFKLRDWMTTGNPPSGADEYDPWGEKLRYPGNEPNAATKAAMALQPDADSRRWVTSSGATLRSETWTQTSGYGREEETIPGTRTSCDQAFLKELMAVNTEHHLIIRLTLRRRRPRYGPATDETDPYPDPYVRYYLIEEDGIARTLKRSH